MSPEHRESSKNGLLPFAHLLPSQVPLLGVPCLAMGLRGTITAVACDVGSIVEKAFVFDDIMNFMDAPTGLEWIKSEHVSVITLKQGSNRGNVWQPACATPCMLRTRLDQSIFLVFS